MRKKTDTEIEDGFLTRWSAKKRRAENPISRANDVSDQDENINRQVPVEQDAEVRLTDVEAEDQAVLTDEDMPEIETLDEKSDFSGFMSSGVSDGLRKLALRKLFRSKVFNVRDGLDDYDDDFRSFAALGDIITSDMKHQMELAEQRQKEKEKQEQQTLAAEQEPALEDSDHGSADDQAGENQAGNDEHGKDENLENNQVNHDNSEAGDDKQENEAGANEPENKRGPQAV